MSAGPGSRAALLQNPLFLVILAFLARYFSVPERRRSANQMPVSNSPYRLVALDIDGTVLDSRQQVSDRLKATLATLVERSVRTVLCTGRRWRTTLPVLEQLDHAHPVVVCSGGALIKRADDDSTLYKMPLKHETARRTVQLYRERGLVPFLLYDRPLDMRELKLPAMERARAERLPYVQVHREWVETCPAYPAGDEDAPLVIYTVDSLDRVRKAEPHIRESLAGRASIKAMMQERYGKDQIALEVHDPGASKWHALCWLLERWKLAPGQVIAVGDDVNDIPMLEAAGMSFAMGNALPEVKEVAQAITADNDEDGVAAALRSVFLRDDT